MKAEIIPKLIDLTKSKCIEVRDQAIIALGFIARHDGDVRDMVLYSGALDGLLNNTLELS